MHSVAWQTSEVPFYYSSQYSVIHIQLLKASGSQEQSPSDVCLQLHKPITTIFMLLLKFSFVLLGIKPKASCILGKDTITSL